MSEAAAALIDDEANELLFSAASVWEVAIKSALRRSHFMVEPQALRRSLFDSGYSEIPITGEHAAAVARLPGIHKDPFDRLLVAQASVEGAVLLTADAQLAEYAGPVRRV
jgi:PIN domain nuclease of toxin-antitoxin system